MPLLPLALMPHHMQMMNVGSWHVQLRYLFGRPSKNAWPSIDWLTSMS